MFVGFECLQSSKGKLAEDIARSPLLVETMVEKSLVPASQSIFRLPVRTSMLTVACAGLNLLRRNSTSFVIWGIIRGAGRVCDFAEKFLPPLFSCLFLIPPHRYTFRVFMLLSI